MSKRIVTLKLTTQKDLVKVESDARTFGELKNELSNVKWDGMRVVERSTKNTLQMDDAVLPATDFILFLVPEKVKSGADKIDIETASYNDLRSHISVLNKMKNAGLSMDGKVDDLRKTLHNYYGEDGGDVTKDPIAIIEDCRAKINEAIDSIIANAKLGVSDETKYAIKLSVDDLEEELTGIKGSLKL